MQIQYGIFATMVFDNEVDRDHWHDLIKDQIIAARLTGNHPAFTGNIHKRTQQVPENIVTNLEIAT